MPPNYAMLLYFFLATSSDSLLAFDVKLTIEVPGVGVTYAAEIIEPQLILEFREGPVSNYVRRAPNNFEVCVEWSAAIGPPINSSCCNISSDGSLSLPSLSTQSWRDGIHFFRAFLRPIASDETLLSWAEVSFLYASGDEPPQRMNLVPYPAVKEPFMPCEWHGIFSAVTPWSRAFSLDTSKPPLALAGPQIDIPLDMRGFKTWREIQQLLNDQFESICLDEFNELERSTGVRCGWNPSSCVADLQRQVKEWLFARCSEDGRQFDHARSDDATMTSITEFRKEVADAARAILDKGNLHASSRDHTLDFSSVDWTLADFDAIFRPGTKLLNDVDNDDGCDDLVAAVGPQVASEHIFIVGDLIGNTFLRRQRDFVLRDLLGCIPRVRICSDAGSRNVVVDVEEAASECESMLKYAQARNYMSSKIPLGRSPPSLQTRWECGPCSDSVEDLNRSSILISSLNGISQVDDFKQGHLDWDLKARWNPRVIIHLDDEAETPVKVLTELYHGSSLVLRMYNHGSSITRLRGHFSQSSTRVLVIPIGYLNGASAATSNEDNKSGTEAVREALRDRAKLSGSALYRWAFVGTRGMHHPYTTDARTAMTSFLSGINGRSMAHLTERDGYVSTSWTADLYRASDFVASPRGESLDCFRHYEALIAGAVPIVDQPKGHEGWSWWADEELDEVLRAGETLAPFPAWPLGWVFPKSAERNNRHQSAQSSSRVLTVQEWPANFCEDAFKTPWRSLARRVNLMGSGEIKLRREMNARWYIAKIQELRGRILHALVDKSCVIDSHVLPSANPATTTSFSMEMRSAQAGSIDDMEDFPDFVANDELSLQSAITNVIDLAEKSSKIVTAIISIQVPRIFLTETLDISGSLLNITIRGHEKSQMSILDGNYSVRVLEVHSGASVHLESIEVANGRAFGYGGGVLVTGSGSALSSGISEFNFNEGCDSFGLAVSFSGNEILGYAGGAMAVMNGAVAFLGRGVDGLGSSFIGNVAASHGGGLVVSGKGSQVSLAAPIFSNNSAYRGGAASAADRSYLQVSNLAGIGFSKKAGESVFHGGARFVTNAAYWDGGALLAVGGSDIVVDGSTAFIGNRVSMGGSVAHLANGATMRLGALESSLSDQQHHSCIFWGNSATHGGMFDVNNGQAVLSLSLPIDLSEPIARAISDELGSTPIYGERDTFCRRLWNFTNNGDGTGSWAQLSK